VQEKVNDQIYVTIEFSKQGPKPQKFIWKNKEYDIKNINFVHQSKEGDTLLTHFSVSGKTDSYKITFNSKDLSWKLNEIYFT